MDCTTPSIPLNIPSEQFSVFRMEVAKALAPFQSFHGFQKQKYAFQIMYKNNSTGFE